MSFTNEKRAKIKLKTPNPLFEKWLMEWIDEAKATGNLLKTNSLINALDSLKKFPLVLKTGKECMILEHFDTNLCVQLDRKLVSHRQNSEVSEVCDNGLVVLNEQSLPVSQSENVSESKTQRTKKSKEYIPAFRSAAYALLLALFRKETSRDYKGFMTKDELQKAAQPLTDCSFKKAQSGSFYTGWNSMSQLIKKGLIIKASNPAKFSLSEEGRQVASRLENSSTSSLSSSASQSSGNDVPSIDIPDLNTIIAPVSRRGKKTENEEIEDSQPVEIEEEDIVLSPGTFDTILLVDTQETSGSSQTDDETVTALKSYNIKFEVRHLKVGDFLWICRCRTTNHELVLPFIVERKRLDDLSSSIIDGRFHEQKFRLKKCGVYNIIYLVEETGGHKFSLPLASLHQAIVNTMVSDEFTVKITRHHNESMSYLATITTLLTNMFRNKVLFSCKKSEWSLDITEDAVFLLTFKTFIHGMGKSRNFKAREMFVKQLVQMHGISADKAWAIANLYATPAAYISALNKSSVPAELVTNVQYGALNRKIGPAISGHLYQFYTLSNLK
ncbi:hypothetical protein O3M35_003575 [Rhynocoris fuscipes]|uniref:Crossover junction endonuclease MUS81 n=1 Tax=Rhynocoris fuscipes TaxID=488301 RepID=A0AAW1CR87_9HEMI